ncbi:hypothetical protein LZ495_18470 [Yinghuangia sp. KLBMP8922]|uniref:DNA helicase n=2 Tax=Yinghuangia soli TaxID=2908204 RepID=A0AA41U2Z7_9ACTN|nr:hypothetical protein [Yinghuangia soli]
MAVYRAWALATIGRRVVLLTRSNLLQQYHAQIAPDLSEAITVTTYHRWVRDFWRRHFPTDPPCTDEQGWLYDWTEIGRRCILHQVRSDTTLVVDEGQNLPNGFYRLCRILRVDVTVFADERQQIGDEESALSEICHLLDADMNRPALRCNRRSSREIALLAAEFQDPGDAEDPPGRSGGVPTVLSVTSLRDFMAEIARYFTAYPDRTIGIICRSTFALRDVQSRMTGLGLSELTQAYVHNDQYHNTFDFSTRPIRIVTTAGMKGLEFDSVFVPDLDAYSEDPTGVVARLRFSVLCTRAREDLYFAYRGPQEPAIIAGIPTSLLARSQLSGG